MSGVRRSIRIGVVSLASLLVITACGTSEPQEPSEGPVVEGGTMRQALVRPASTDPAKAQTVSERVLATQLYSTLTKWDPAKSQAIPALASGWKVSDDQLRWTFALRDQTAADGQPVSATDVKQSLEHIARRSTGSLLAETLSPVSGWSDFTANSSVSSLTGIVVVDPKTVQIDLSSPFSELPSLLSNPSFGIVHASGEGGSGAGVPGPAPGSTTGPYVVSAQSTDSWTLSKIAGTSTHLDQIEIKFFADVRASYKAFTDGLADWTPIAPADADAAGKVYGTSLFEPSLRTVGLSFNLANPKFADVRFREAIVRAIDRTEVAMRLDIHASVLNGVVPSGAVGEQAGGCSTLCFHDRRRAQQLVKDVFPNGAPTLTIDVAKGSPFTDTALVQLTDDLLAIGVATNVRNATTSDQFGSVTVQPEREIFQTSWSAAYPTAGAFLDPLYRSTSKSNVSGLRDVEVDKGIDRAFATTSYEGRIDAYRDAEKSTMNNLPVIPIAEFPVDSVQTGRMKGMKISPYGTFDITNVWAAGPVS